MRNWLLICVLAAGSTAQADVLDNPADIIRAVNAGRQGAWLDTEALRKASLCATNLDSYREEIGVADTVTDVLTHKVIDLKLRLEVDEKEIEKLRMDNHLDAERAKSLERELESWYRNPWVMCAIGIAGGVFITSTTYVIVRAYAP